MMRDFLKRTDRGVLVLGIIFLIAFPVLFKPWIHGADTIGYYSWLHSLVIDSNLQTSDEFEHYGMGWLNSYADTGLRDNPGAVGSAVLWTPWFLAAHGFTLLGRALGLPWIADGYGQQYILAVSLGSTVYAFAALLIAYRLTRDFFVSPAAVLAVAAVWLSSPLVFYMYSHPLMTHTNDAFAYALFLFTWHRTREHRNAAQYGLLGLTAALCALVRNQNAVLVLFPLLEIVFSTARAGRRGEGWKQAASEGLLKGGFFSVAWWLAFLPQLLVWHAVFGTWLTGNPYAHSGGGTFDFFRPHILGVLFSTNHGLFVWTPLMLPAVLGWFPLWRRDRRLTSLLVINFALQLYVIGSWSSWNGSAAFGQRFFTNMVPAFALGLAALLNMLNQRVRFRWLAAACALFVVWNGLLIVRYVVGDVPHLGPVPLYELIVGQFTVIPRHLSRIVRILITRE
ncbi:MAG: glycosyltransferase family 39 protein [Chloroflexi bacterium]|nr:glycosyltransferase family 39 protein [Chloroflexota bacterium]